MTLPSALDIFASPKWFYSVDVPTPPKIAITIKKIKVSTQNYFSRDVSVTIPSNRLVSQKAEKTVQINFLSNSGKYVHKCYLICPDSNKQKYARDLM